jgi:hypothetical protein
MVPAAPLQQSYFRLVLTAEQVKLFYSGDKTRVQVTDSNGKTLNIPWSTLVAHVTPLGVRGDFVIRYDQQGKLGELRRLRPTTPAR